MNLKLIVAVLYLCLVTPISMYLQYQILRRVNASELMWFLFWVNLPVIVFGTLVTRIKGDSK